MQLLNCHRHGLCGEGSPQCWSHCQCIWAQWSTFQMTQFQGDPLSNFQICTGASCFTKNWLIKGRIKSKFFKCKQEPFSYDLWHLQLIHNSCNAQISMFFPVAASLSSLCIPAHDKGIDLALRRNAVIADWPLIDIESPLLFSTFQFHTTWWQGILRQAGK